MSRWTGPRRGVWIWLPVAFFVTCAGWALASPPGSSPDDDYHLSSIWCAGGIAADRCEESPGNADFRLVPRNVAQASDCYRYDASANAGCNATVADDVTLVPTDRVNDIAGLYPAGYYRAMSLLVSDDVERSVLLMRLTDAALVSVLLALLLRTVPAGIGFAATTAMVVTFLPLGLFVVASTNPSGWASAGIALFWGFALALLHRRDWLNRRTWLIAIGAVLTAGMAVSSRVDAAAYLGFAAVLVLVLAGRRCVRSNVVSTAVVAGLGTAGLVVYAAFDTPGGGAEMTMGTADRGVGLLLSNLVYLPALFQGVVGGWALGWNDTVLPPVVPIVGALVLGGLMWVGVSRMWPRKAWASGMALLALVAVPVWFLQKEGLGVGEVVQPRYLLPLLCLLTASLLLDRPASAPITLHRTPFLAAIVALTGSAVVSFWSNAHRYSFGDEVGLFDLRTDPEWVGPMHPLLLLVIVTMSSALLMGGLLRLGRTTTRASREA